ncbi:hypothetical protein GVAV_000928 [Gurleya vavrai]
MKFDTKTILVALTSVAGIGGILIIAYLSYRHFSADSKNEHTVENTNAEKLSKKRVSDNNLQPNTEKFKYCDVKFIKSEHDQAFDKLLCAIKDHEDVIEEIINVKDDNTCNEFNFLKIFFKDIKMQQGKDLNAEKYFEMIYKEDKELEKVEKMHKDEIEFKKKAEYKKNFYDYIDKKLAKGLEYFLELKKDDAECEAIKLIIANLRSNKYNMKTSKITNPDVSAKEDFDRSKDQQPKISVNDDELSNFNQEEIEIDSQNKSEISNICENIGKNNNDLTNNGDGLNQAIIFDNNLVPNQQSVVDQRNAAPTIASQGIVTDINAQSDNDQSQINNSYNELSILHGNINDSLENVAFKGLLRVLQFHVDIARDIVDINIKPEENLELFVIKKAVLQFYKACTTEVYFKELYRFYMDKNLDLKIMEKKFDYKSYILTKSNLEMDFYDNFDAKLADGLEYYFNLITDKVKRDSLENMIELLKSGRMRPEDHIKHEKENTKIMLDSIISDKKENFVEVDETEYNPNHLCDKFFKSKSDPCINDFKKIKENNLFYIKSSILNLLSNYFNSNNKKLLDKKNIDESIPAFGSLMPYDKDQNFYRYLRMAKILDFKHNTIFVKILNAFKMYEYCAYKILRFNIYEFNHEALINLKTMMDNMFFDGFEYKLPADELLHTITMEFGYLKAIINHYNIEKDESKKKFLENAIDLFLIEYFSNGFNFIKLFIKEDQKFRDQVDQMILILKR